MKKNLVAALAACVLTCPALAAAGGPAAFKDKPTVTASGDKVKVAFSVAESTDVEVAVLDAAGKVVRHLAAGVLGGGAAKNPPPPPLAAGLSQQLTWDGKDDESRPVPEPATCKVRVRLGMGVKFGRIIGSSPWTGTLGETAALAVAPDGALYVKMASLVPQLHEYNPWQLRQFDRTGKYQKTHLPYPPSTDPAKAPAFKLIDAGDGKGSLLTPVNMTPLDPVTFYLGDSICSRTVDGSVVFLDSRQGKLNFVKLDGSNAIKAVPMRSKPDNLKWSQVTPIVAFSPDGKTAYYSNLANIPYDPKTLDKLDPKFPQGRIYRQAIGQAGSEPEKFFDLPLANAGKPKMWVPDAWNRRTAAAGIDVDAKGNILVGDLVDQQVVEISPAGKQLSATKVDWPDRLAVSRKTGAIYVVSRKVSEGGVPPAELIKITGRGESAKVEARLPLASPLGQTIAVDDSGDGTVVWVGGGDRTIRVEDGGEKLEQSADLGNADKNAIDFVCFGDVDREADLVYVTSGMAPVWRYNGETGEGGLTPIKACDVAIGPGGHIYGWGDTGKYAGPIARYSRDLKPAPLANGKNTYGSVYGRYGRGNNAPGMAVDNRGWVYAICGFNDCHMRVYDAEGKLAEFGGRKANVGEENKAPIPAFLAYVMDQGGSVRVDKEFNVYVLEIGMPKGFVRPKGFEKDPGYDRCTGTIWKFTPKGGTFKKVGNNWEPEGATQGYSGCGPISGSWNSTGSVCHCNRPRFDVDPFGRLYIPHGFTYKVSVRDNANNEILNFGGYGNYDAAGPASTEPKPEIPLGEPIFSMASENHIYVGDYLNHRVVRVDKTYAAEETAAAK